MDGWALERQCHEVAQRVQRGEKGYHQWPAELRASILAYTESCTQQGESENQVAKRLGIWQSTLSRWRRKARKAAFRQVAIVPSEGAVAPMEHRSIRLITPNGYQVEGLGPELLVAVLRALG